VFISPAVGKPWLSLVVVSGIWCISINLTDLSCQCFPTSGWWQPVVGPLGMSMLCQVISHHVPFPRRNENGAVDNCALDVFPSGRRLWRGDFLDGYWHPVARGTCLLGELRDWNVIPVQLTADGRSSRHGVSNGTRSRGHVVEQVGETESVPFYQA